MNKEDIVYLASKKTGMSYIDCFKYIDVIFEAIKEELVNGGSVVLQNFGSFSVVNRAARKGFNPHTREEIDIPACNEPVFKPGKELKEIVNSTTI